MSLTTSAPDLGDQPLVPQNPQDIHITSRPAIAQWQGLGQTSVLKDLFLDINHSIRSDEAFFKLSALVHLKDYRRIRMRIHLFIHPERVQSLTLGESMETQHKLGSGTVCLKFSLSRPMTLLGS